MKRAFDIDGETVTLVAVSNDEDGGVVTETYVPDGSGGHFVYRAWRGRGIRNEARDRGRVVQLGDDKRPAAEVRAEKAASQQEAIAVFDGLTEQDVARYAARAKEQKEPGTLPSATE